jgi:hypothetical protein
MTFSREFALHGGFRPLWRVQSWALERAAVIHCHSGDLRWTIVRLGLEALDLFVQRQLAAWARRIITRALRGARFASTADTTVAAGGSQARRLFREIWSLA